MRCKLVANETEREFVGAKVQTTRERGCNHAAENFEGTSPDMDVGPFFFTQPTMLTQGPNPPITHLREMQTPALWNPYFYMSVDEINIRFLVVIN